MKKFTSLLIAISCSLALAGAAFAQQQDEQPSPNKGNKRGTTEKAEKTEVKPERNATKNQNPEGTPNSRQRGLKNERGVSKAEKKDETTPKTEESATGNEKKGAGEEGATTNATQGGKHQAGQGRKEMKERAVENNEKTSTNATSGTTATSATNNERQGVNNNAARGEKKKADPQQVQQIRAQHTNFRAQPRPDKVPAVTFNANFRIQGSDHWQGTQYEAFRSYHPERHDEGWYRSHYRRVELIGGGYYYWNNGYYIPAWGYSPSAEYYPYDGPIYVGQRAEPLDQVVADVQSELQEMGYYQGEVDGLLGPLTQQALAAYQADQGLPQTAALDEPTFDSLGMNS